LQASKTFNETFNEIFNEIFNDRVKTVRQG